MTAQRPRDPNDHIPRDYNGWFKRAKAQGVAHLHMSDVSILHSASRMTEKEFLSLRAIWPERFLAQNFPFPNPRLPMEIELKEKADRYLSKFTAFQTFLRHVRDKNQDLSHVKLGAFALVLDSFQQIGRKTNAPVSESDPIILRRSARDHGNPTYSSPFMNTRSQSERSRSTAISDITAAADSEVPYTAVTKDEQIVNDALLQFLKALTIPIPKVQCRWSSARSPFDKVDFGKNQMTARVDGYLEGNDLDDIFAIIEVKPRIRSRASNPEILWQETAEMVAWIMHESKNGRKSNPRRRLLISQDHHEIYLTVGINDPDYEEWLKGTNKHLFPPLKPFKNDEDAEKPYDDNLSLLQLHEYGPFAINNDRHLEKLARIFVCLAMQATSDINDARKSILPGR